MDEEDAKTLKMLEDMIRRVVREELSRGVVPYPWPIVVPAPNEMPWPQPGTPWCGSLGPTTGNTSIAG
mgnify:FL=1|jgi:hypothetical protein